MPSSLRGPRKSVVASGGVAQVDERVTIRQVAEAAHVSPATVSRVLSGSTRVDEEMRARTLATAERLGYRANKVAQAMRTRSIGAVGMVVPNITNPFFPGVIQAVERQLRQSDIRLLLCDSEDDVAQEAELLLSLLDHRIDGILLSACDRIASRSAARMVAGHVPLVQVDRVTMRDHPYVGVDHAQAMSTVLAHLVDQGCSQFAYVSSSLGISTAAERLRAYVDYVRPVDARSAERVYIGDFSLAWGKEAAAMILADGNLPDAIVCVNDLVAVGVLDTLRQGGVTVPEDVLVTGFDDTVLAAAAWPPLTSVRQPLEEIGREAVRIVLSGPTRDPRARVPKSVMPADLIVRTSTQRLRPARYTKSGSR